MPPSQPHAVPTPRGTLHVARWPAPVPTGAEPLVLLHDSLGCVELWRDFPARLAAACGRDVIAYDRLGFGRSAPNPARFGPGFIEAEAHGDFAAVRAALGVDRFVVFGYSVGGGMAAGIAAAFPDACIAMVTMSAQAFVEDVTLAGVRIAQQAYRDPARRERLAKYHGAKVDWILSAWIDTWLDPAYAAWTLDAALAGVRCPTLAIHGEHDEYGSMAHPQRIVAGVRGPATLLALECGHMPQRDAVEAVLAAVAAHVGGAAA
jgi:pimeloyl-ACP methyl ester carboxylesterase